MIFTTVFLLLTVLASSGGNLALSRAMKRVGEFRDFSLAHLLDHLRRSLRQPFLWLGIALNALAFFSMLVLFSRKDLSFVVPATAASYLFNTLGSRFLLGERVSGLRWLGSFIVAFGVVLTLLG